MKTILPLAALLALSACTGGDGQSAADNAADQLEDAAEMSNPAAAPVLENGAEKVRESGNAAAAHNVIEQAGNAQSK